MDLQAIAVIWYRDVIRFLRDRPQILGSIARPILWLLFVGFGLGAAFRQVHGMPYIQFIFPGVVALNLLFASFLSAISIIWDREFGFLREILVAPIPRTSIALGKAASGATTAVLQGLIVLAFAPVVHVAISPAQLLAAVGLMFALAFACTSIGILIASRMTSFEGFGVISNFIIMPMFVLSGAIFPVEGLPNWLAVFLHVNPMTYGVDGLRSILLGRHRFPLMVDVGFVVAFAALMLVCAVALFERGER